ncbi:MAG: patatin-like phospholipase RssA [bacterium]
MNQDRLKPRIGIALGGGAARGWAHIGVINTLAQMGIHPEIVAGTSIGALVGAAYASHKLHLLESWVRQLGWKEILGFIDPVVSRGGLIQGDKLFEFAQRHIKDRAIEQLNVQFGAVATDLQTGREVWFREGSLFDSVRASIALPGLFTPVAHQDSWLVDGGLVDPVPVSLCRAMGADIVIAVNLNAGIVGRHQKPKKKLQGEKKKVFNNLFERRMNQEKPDQVKSFFNRLFGKSRVYPNMFEVTATSINIMQDRITRSRMAGDPPEILLNPSLVHMGLMDFDEAECAIAEGVRCTEQMQVSIESVVKSASDII